MVNFSSIFHQMFRKKNRIVQRLFILEIIAGVLTTSYFQVMNRSYESETFIHRLSINAFVTFLFVSLAFDIAYLIYSIFIDEKIYKSQTWRLIPIKNWKLILSNVFSSISSGILLVLGQSIILALLLLSNSGIRDFWKILQNNFGSIAEQKLWENIKLLDIFYFALVSLLIVIFIYSIVTLINLLSEFISNYVIRKYRQLARFGLIIVISSIVLIMISSYYEQVYILFLGYLQGGMFLKAVPGSSTDYIDTYITTIVFLIVNTVIFILNSILLSKYSEAAN